MALLLTPSLGWILMLAGLAATVGYIFGLLRSQASLRKTVLGLRREFDARIQQLETSLKEAPRPAPIVLASPVTAPTTPASEPLSAQGPAKSEEVSQEALLIIAAAVTAFLGKKVRVRSAKMLQSPYEIINPWAQQGRVFVQASHNLARGRE